jgi:hypothetical protein
MKLAKTGKQIEEEQRRQYKGTKNSKRFTIWQSGDIKY